MLLEIFLIIIGISVFIGMPFFILKAIQVVIREGISQGKQNITINNVNQPEQKPDFGQIQAILQHIPVSKLFEPLQIPKQSKTSKSQSNKKWKSRR